jgi:glucuronosyltransferase
MDAVDSPLSFDHVPGIYSYTDEMNLFGRLKNTVMGLYSLYFRNWIMLPFYESLARQALERPDLPPIREIEKNVSYLITNTHYSVTYQYPKTSAIVEVGGLHCVPSKPLPQVKKKL